MQIIISPAKKMLTQNDDFLSRTSPCFEAEADQITKILQSYSKEELKKLWGCSDQLVFKNYTLLHGPKLSKQPALFAYVGLQYQALAPDLLEDAALAYLSEHLKILSGLYGILRPFDGIRPYRLEMQAKLKIGQAKDLYAFWGAKLYQKLYEKDQVVINLASKEYAKSITKYLRPHDRFITCIFGEEQADQIVQKATKVKKARGEMVRFLAQNNVTDLEQLKTFDELGYQFDQKRSTATQYIFIQRNKLF